MDKNVSTTEVSNHACDTLILVLENMVADCRFGLLGLAFFLLPLFSSQEMMSAIASKDSFYWY